MHLQVPFKTYAHLQKCHPVMQVLSFRETKYKCLPTNQRLLRDELVNEVPVRLPQPSRLELEMSSAHRL